MANVVSGNKEVSVGVLLVGSTPTTSILNMITSVKMCFSAQPRCTSKESFFLVRDTGSCKGLSQKVIFDEETDNRQQCCAVYHHK